MENILKMIMFIFLSLSIYSQKDEMRKPLPKPTFIKDVVNKKVICANSNLTNLTASIPEYDTFESLNYYYSKDKNNIYFECSVIDEADVNTFKVPSSDINTAIAIDKNNLYLANGNGYSKSYYNIINIKNRIDYKTFQFVKFPVFKDKNNVFLFSLNDIKTFEGADPHTFEIFNHYYSKDKSNIYYENIKIIGADSDSFIIFNGPHAKDKSNVYFENKIIKGADPATIKELSYYYVKDENNVFYKDKKIKKADSKTFFIEQHSKNSNCRKKIDAFDINHKYYQGEITNDNKCYEQPPQIMY